MHAFRTRIALAVVASTLVASTTGVPAAWAGRPVESPRSPRPVANASALAQTPATPQATAAEVAARHGLSEAELAKRMKVDKGLKIGRGRLLFEDAPLADLVQGAEVAPSASLAAGSPLPGDAFTLHSLPGSKRVIYLDFDGHLLSKTAWNDSNNAGVDITAPPFDTDSNPSAFSDAERNVVIGAWQRVAEDYAAFDVDVTTQYPGEEAINRISSSDEYYGMRVLISPISSYFGNYGGIAYVGVFDSIGEYYKPALVFPERLANSEKYIGEASAHENGHTAGLYHDGTTAGVTYYAGHGSGETGWAPIMGNSYSRNLTQWSRGEYPSANNPEDDLAIAQSNGLAHRPDDYGNAPAAAYGLPSGSTFAATGMIERNTDVDVFRLDAGAGVITVSASPALRGPDLDILAELRDNSGALVASGNSADVLSGSISVNVPSGTYYLSVSGTSKGDLATGYSGYACLGNYAISGTMTPSGVVQLPPVASVKATPSSGVAPLSTQFDSTLSSDPDGSIVGWSWEFGDGTSSTLPNPSHTYATPGTFSAWLTVIDNSGLTATANTIVTVTPANAAPVAAITANPASGVAPLVTTFSGAASSDPDGSIVSYSWDFGDGSAGTGVSASHTYTAAGTFTARLTVTDNAGATASSTTVVSVSAAPAVVIRVASVQMTLSKSKAGYQVRTTVRVTQEDGTPVSGASVSGVWSGRVTGPASGLTDANGYATLLSKRFKSAGSVTFSVTNVTKSGCVYDPTKNAASGGSV